MKELSSYELCLLIYLCYKSNRKSFSPANDTRKDECFRIWDKLRNIVNTHCGSEVISVIESAGLEITTTRKTLLIKVVDKTLLEEFLDEYSAHIKTDTLISYDYDRYNFNRLEAKFDNLLGKLRNSVNKNKVLKEYFIDNTFYLPVILWGLREKFIKFKDIRFSLAPDDEQLDVIPNIELMKRKLKNDGNDASIIDFCITLDLSNFTKLRGLSRIDEQAQERPQYAGINDEKVENPEWRIFTCIYEAVKEKRADNGICLIHESAFTDMHVDIDSTFGKNKGYLNRKVRIALGKKNDKRQKLIKQNKKNKLMYEIDMNLYNNFIRLRHIEFANYLKACESKSNLL